MTKYELEQFEFHVRAYMKQMGLDRNWVTTFEVVSNKADDFRARIYMNAEQRICQFQINEAMDLGDYGIQRLALHEVLHLLLYPIIHATENKAPEAVVVGLEHDIINILLNTIDHA